MPVARLADQLGRVLNDRYRLVAPIGTGASGNVYLAEDVTLRRKVAVKLLHPALADDPSFLKRFQAEARAVASLTHPHIVSVHDWGELADGPYLVLEYLSGGNLRHVLDGDTLLTPSQAATLGIQAARGLDFAHRRGLVHRDVKPANLLFDGDGNVKVGDFGLARALAEASWTEPTGAVVGSARYASPEQASGSPLDGKADVYSLALVLVEAVTGEVPFAADTTLATLMGRVGAEFSAPEALGTLGPIVERAAHPDPSRRPSAGVLVSQLEAALREMPAAEPLSVSGPIALHESDLRPDRDETQLAPRRSSGSAPTSVALNGVVAHSVTGAASRRRLRLPRRWWLVLLVPALIFGAVRAVQAISVALAPSHEVPRVVGDNALLAGAKLSRLKFDINAVHVRRDGTTAGQVLDQSPAPGQDLKEGQTITVTVSDGQTLSAIPDLRGLAEADAAKRVSDVGLTPALVYSYHEEIEKGVVIDWQPNSQEIEKGSTVQVAISSGPRPRQVPTGLSGMTYDQAAAKIKDAGLVPTKVTAYSDSVRAGLVVWVSPKDTAPKGSTVQVAISLGPETVTVPMLGGLTPSEAEAALNNVGLSVGGVSGSPTGKVVAASPSGGSKVRRGTAVTLTTQR